MNQPERYADHEPLPEDRPKAVIMDHKPWTTTAYLDVNDRNPDLFGDVILLRDDGPKGPVGFALLGLKELIGKHVRITIEECPE